MDEQKTYKKLWIFLNKKKTNKEKDKNVKVPFILKIDCFYYKYLRDSHNNAVFSKKIFKKLARTLKFYSLKIKFVKLASMHVIAVLNETHAGVTYSDIKDIIIFKRGKYKNMVCKALLFQLALNSNYLRWTIILTLQIWKVDVYV